MYHSYAMMHIIILRGDTLNAHIYWQLTSRRNEKVEAGKRAVESNLLCKLEVDWFGKAKVITGITCQSRLLKLI